MSTATVTLEQLISTFGEVVGKQMHAQMNAGQGGAGAPFPFLKKVSTHGSEVGAFGDFVFGMKTEKDAASGDKVVTEKGTNIGTSFEFIIVNVCYRYTFWDEAKQKSYRSNIFTSLDDIKKAVDAYTGKPLPETKEAKKAAGWKLNRINTGLVRASAKEAWTPVIFEVSGSLYFSLGEVVGKQPFGGLLSGVTKLSMKLASKGSTQYSVIDVPKSSFGPLPKDIFTAPELVTALGDITTKMTEYQAANQYNASASTSTAPSASAPVADEDELPEW